MTDSLSFKQINNNNCSEMSFVINIRMKYFHNVFFFSTVYVIHFDTFCLYLI